MTPKPTHKDVWTFDLDSKVFIEVVHWGVDRERSEFTALNNGNGVWNYYCSIPERVMPDRFEELWLPVKMLKFSEAGAEHESYDYMKAPFANVSWRCGITFYAQIGQNKGHRIVKLGCDYSHLYDQEHGYPYSRESVCNDALETAKQLIELYKI